MRAAVFLPEKRPEALSKTPALMRKIRRKVLLKAAVKAGTAPRLNLPAKARVNLSAEPQTE